MNTSTHPPDGDDLGRLRHSAAHVMVAAVSELYPGTKFGSGGETHDGFYYDFEAPRTISSTALYEIEDRMRHLMAADLLFRCEPLDRDRLVGVPADQPYQREIAEQAMVANHGPPCTLCSLGDVVAVCSGAHLDSTGDLDPRGFKLLGISGAYWRGDETRPQLQRIHGTAWPTVEQLENHLAATEAVRDDDHRRIGEELDLFAFDPAVGAGLPLWLPAGTAVRDALEAWAKETERAWGYQRIATPHVTRAELYERSAHLPYFADDMYPPMDAGSDRYYVRPMNCPHHMAAFAARHHSYRELPLRYAEYGAVYRHERSGELNGLMRVRGMTQNDAHIFCRLEQARDEFIDVMRMHAFYYDALGIDGYHMVLALRDPDNLAKYHSDSDMWDLAERITRAAAEESGISYTEEVGGAAHYGPKIDFVFRSVTGRDYGAATAQLDLYLPERFDLSFTNELNQPERPAVIHRAPLGSHERFIGFLIEHYGGAFPPWLAPIQVSVVRVGDEQEAYAQEVTDVLFRAGFRVDLSHAHGTVGAQIRSAEQRKIPFTLVVGGREAVAQSVSVRSRGGVQRGEMTLDAFRGALAANIEAKSLTTVLS